MEYNIGLMELVAKLLKIDLQISLTDSYKKEYDSATYTDFRSLIHPKKTSTHTFNPYMQVFGNKHGFIPDLSIVDVLFNNGRESLSYLNIN